MGYYAGDKVIIKSRYELNKIFKEYECNKNVYRRHTGFISPCKRYVFNSLMFRYCGCRATIKEVVGVSGKHWLTIDNKELKGECEFYWIDDWLKPAVHYINIMD